MKPLQIMPHDLSESWWINKAKRNGISRKKYYARRRRGCSRQRSIQPGKLDRWSEEETMSSIARRHGIRPRSVHEWYRRHPEHRGRDPREVIQWMVANKRRWKK